MEEYKLYLITIAAVAIALLTVYFAIKIYKKKKRALEAEIEQAHAQLHQTEIQTQNRLNQMEQEAQSRIRAAEAELKRKTDEFNDRVNQFNKEQELRENLNGKTDREVIIEMHVKAERIADAITNIEDKLVGVRDYSQQLESLENNLTQSVSDLESSLEDSVNQMQAELHSSFDDMDSTIRNAISENMNTLDESDVRSACADAMNYDCYSFKSDIESAVQSALSSELDSKLSDLDWKLCNIESKLES
jgi:LPS O-antigen subunit length determinant protein (WzzB/FepE family)